MANEGYWERFWRVNFGPLPPDLPLFEDEADEDTSPREPNEDELVLGRTLENPRTWKYVSDADRDAHFYIVGATRRGKTGFMKSLVIQDIKNGKGFGVIDPHADFVRDIKGHLALSDDDLEERVVLIDPTDKENCVCFNPLELTGDMTAATLAGQLIDVFKKIWGEQSVMARSGEILRNSLTALIENGQTLDEVDALLNDPAVRRKFVSNVKNPECQRFFRKYDEVWTKHERTEWTAATLNKVGAFLADDKLRQILISPKSTFDLRDIMDNGKILLVNLDDGHLGESGKLFGALLLSRIQSAALTRTDTEDDRRRFFYLYIDEFQNFAADEFTKLINQTAKYKLVLTMAHQDLTQLTQELKSAVRNCGLQAYFKLNRPDAEQLAKEAFAGVFDEPQPWETYIQELQTSPYRICFIKSSAGGIIEIETPDVIPAHEQAGLDREAFKIVIQKKNIGGHYLRKRKDVEEVYQKRHAALVGKEHDADKFWEEK